MGWKSKVVYPFAKSIANKLLREEQHPIKFQQKIFNQLIAQAKDTKFGKDYGFGSIKSYQEFKNQIPLLKYSDIEKYIALIQQGKENILWPGLPKYFVGTSGTTSGIKYIPLTKESMPYHFGSARNATFSYCANNDLMEIFDGKMIFLSGSPELYKKGHINTGRLSGIMNREIPKWIRANQIPTYGTNCIEDWEQKIKQIVLESVNEDMTMISGITPWIIMYAEYLLDHSGKATLKALFPKLKLIIHGGVNFSPYKTKLQRLAGSGVKYLETYPASEGFIAAQVSDNQDLRLNVNGGIFFEFIDSRHLDDSSKRIALEDAEIGKDYAIILNTNAGFFSYLLGDTVEFTSLSPYRIKVTGRINQFISAFGEHVVVNEVEQAIVNASKTTGIGVSEFCVAPNIPNDKNQKAYHEWFIEFEEPQISINEFSHVLDKEMQAANFQYKDLVLGKVIAPLKIRPMQKNSFRKYLKSIGKLGGQNKVPKLNNNRIHADKLIAYQLTTGKN